MSSGERWGGPGEDYRLRRITSNGHASADHAPVTGSPQMGHAAPVWDIPRKRRALPWFEIIFITLGTLGVTIATISYVSFGGAASTALVAALALIPLFFVLALIEWVDRWEPEPMWSRLVALLWGAGVATLAASIFNTAMLINVALVTGDESSAMATVAVFVAPVVEETLKGIGVVIIVLWRRASINSILDGVVYAGYAGAGFAFVENIQYFLDASSSGAGVLGATVFVRGVLSPFVHPMATSFIGMALAFAVVRSRSPLAWMWWGPVGWVVAVAVHGLWNFLATVGGTSWLAFYLFVQVPLFALWVTGLLVASQRETRAIAHGLEPYVRTGWILPAEVRMVVDRGGRAASKRWAALGGRDAAKAMKRFKTNAAALGLDQTLMERVGPQGDRVAHDRQLLAELGAAREEFLRLTAVSAGQRR